MPITHADFKESMRAQMMEIMADALTNYPELFVRITGAPRQIGDGQGSYIQSTSIVGFKMFEQQDNELDALGEDKISEGYTTYAKWRTFGKTINISEQSMRDDKAGVIRSLTEYSEEWARAYVQTRNQFVADHFNYGGLLNGHDIFNQTVPKGSGASGLTDPTGGLIYDGKPLFALTGNNHIPYDTNKNTGTYYNAVALAPSYANLVTVWNLMTATNNKDESGNPIIINPDVLMCPKSQELTWQQILQSNILTDTSKNVIQNRLQILANPFLTNANAWFLIDTSLDGIRFYERQLPEIKMIEKNNASIDVYGFCRYGTMVKNWRPFAGSDLLTA